MALHITGDPEADAQLDNPFSLLVGMLLDQQVLMEHAFAGPATIASRMGVTQLDPAAVADYDPEEFVALASQRPAVHRFPKAMAERTQKLARHIVEHYEGEASNLLAAETGAELLRRLKKLPGFGDAKAKIMLALLGKQCGITPDGWREAAGDYGKEGVTLSVADVVDAESLQQVRATKKEIKRRAKQAQ